MDESSLLAIEREAAVIEAAAPLPGAPAAAPAADPVGEAKAVFGMAVAMLSPLLPYLPTIYTEQTLGALASAYVPVAQKYGWDLPGMLGEYGAEIALVGTAVPLAMQTYVAHKAYVASKQPPPKQQAKLAAAPNDLPSPPGDAATPPAPAPQAPAPAEDRGGRLMPAPPSAA